MIGHFTDDDRLDPIEPPSLPIERHRKEETIKVTCCQGTVLFLVLFVIFLGVMCASIYVGFWINLHDEDEYALVVTAGSPSLNSSSTVSSTSAATFLLPLHVKTSTCSRPPPAHPLSNLVGAVGAVLGKRLRVCGGRREDSNETLAECRTLDRDKWVVKHGGDSGLIRMTTGRAFAAAAVVTDVGWWVTGGVDAAGGLLKTTEIVESISIDPKFEGGPLLPEPTSKHCLVRMSQSRVLLIGGSTDSDEFSSLTWEYDWQDRKDRWRAGPRLGQGRHSHACFGYYDRVVVAGGALAGWEDGSDSAEVYRKEDDMWKAIAALPHRMMGGFAFFWGKEPTLAGGSEHLNLITYNEDDGWVSEKKKFLSAVRYPVSVTTKMSWVCV